MTQQVTVASGMYNFLYNQPWWILPLFLDIVVIDLLFLGRQFFEGFPYNISWSSQYGDRMLIGCVLLGVYVLQKNGLPPTLAGNYQHVCLFLGVVSGVCLQLFVLKRDHWQFGTNMDTYHNLVIVSLLVYFLLLLVPVIIIHGTTRDILSATILSAIWVATFFYDHSSGRLDQPKWLTDHGYKVVLEKRIYRK